MTLAEKNFIKETPAKGFRRHFSLTDRLNKTQAGDNNDTKHEAICPQCPYMIHHCNNTFHYL